MTSPDIVARRRWLAITLTRLAGTAGAVFGLVLIGRSPMLGDRVLGAAIVLSAILLVAIVPKALARRWRTPQP